MQLATQTSYSAAFFGMRESVEMIKEAGFDSIDFSMFCMSDENCILNTDGYIDYVRRLKAIARRNDIKFSQAHAPFSFPIKHGERYFMDIVKERVTRSIEIAGMLDIPVMVVHPMQFRPYHKKKNQKFFRELNVKYYSDYMPMCEEAGIKIACENIWKTRGKKHKKHIIGGACATPERFKHLIDAVDNEHFTGCLDLGHCGLTGIKAQDFIREVGEGYISALHVHDNDNIRDLHTAPGYGKMEWDEIAKALAEINYDGDVTFEADEFIAPFANDPRSALQALKLLNSIGRNFIRRIEYYKEELSDIE
ncbi:MAG: sugar phosphate isomerase/epimerase [Clostridia bacterium]|nr:sugar phosphate isomerase/epimerase [Clostridia bacterium]